MFKNQFQSPFREILNIFGLQINVDATITAKSSQAWSAREKDGAKAELLPKMKFSADVFQQGILYCHILQYKYKTELIVLIHLFKEEMAFGGYSDMNWP